MTDQAHTPQGGNAALSNFLWGATVCAHGAEGNDTASDWWQWEQRPGRIRMDATSRDGAHHTEHYPSDFKLAHTLAHNACCLSLSWSRIQPEPGRCDEKALNHYQRVMETLAELGMTPVCALQEISAPQWFTEQGGWLGRRAPELFAAYAERVIDAVGSYCQWWIPIMAPAAAAAYGYGEGHWPPGKRGWRMDAALRRQCEAMARAADALRRNQPEARIGAPLEATHVLPHEDGRAWDLRAARWEDQWWNRAVPGYWRALSGHEDAFDFVAMAFEGTIGVQFHPFTWRPLLRRRMNSAGEPTGVRRPRPDVQGFRSELRRALSWGKPVLLSGVGWGTSGDQERCRHLLDHLAVVFEFLKDNAPIAGYFHRSLLDSFEWLDGYSRPYGLIHVDQSSFARTPQNSAYLFQDVITHGGIRKGAAQRFCPDWTPPEDVDSNAGAIQVHGSA